MIRIKDSSLLERNYRNIRNTSKLDSLDYDDQSIRKAMIILCRELADDSSRLLNYLESTKQENLSDKKINNFLKDMRGFITSIGKLNKPEDYPKRHTSRY